MNSLIVLTNLLIKWTAGLRQLLPVIIAIILSATVAPDGFLQILLNRGGEIITGRAPEWTTGHSLLTLWMGSVWCLLYSRLDFQRRLLLALGLMQFLLQVYLMECAAGIGHADPASYANMTRSLLEGRGFSVENISWYFRSYASILRPEEHWPPLLSFLQLPFMMCMGKSVLAATMPGLLIQSILMPLVMASVLIRLSRQFWLGFLSGLFMMINPDFFREILTEPRADVPYTFFILLTIYCFVKACENPAMWVAWGLAAGFCVYGKGTGVLLIPVYPLVWCSWRWIRGKRNIQLIPRWINSSGWKWMLGAWVIFTWSYPDSMAIGALLPSVVITICLLWYFSRRLVISEYQWVLLGCMAMVLVLLPWMIRNTLHFNQPFYSTQQHCSGYIGLVPWEEGTYQFYRGKNVPTTMDRFDDMEKWQKHAKEIGVQYLLWGFVQPLSRRHNQKIGLQWPIGWVWPVDWVRQWMKAEPKTQQSTLIWPFGLLTWFLLPLSVLLGLIFMLSVVLKRWIRMRRIDSLLDQWLEPRILAPLLCFWIHVCFLTIFWDKIYRLALPLQMMNLLIGWWAIGVLIKWLLIGIAAICRVPIIKKGGVFVLLLFFYCSADNPALLYPKDMTAYREQRSREYRHLALLGGWLKTNDPQAVVMTRNPWELHWYSHGPAVQIPLSSLDEILSVAKFYHVSYLNLDRQRPALKNIDKDMPDWLENVDLPRGAQKMFRIRWDHLPNIESIAL